MYPHPSLSALFELVIEKNPVNPNNLVNPVKIYLPLCLREKTSTFNLPLQPYFNHIYP